MIRTLAAILMLATATPAFAQDDEDENRGLLNSWLERTAIAEADAACNLFTEGERLALQSGLYQSLGELLRTSRSEVELEQKRAGAVARARSLGCASPIVSEVAANMRASFREFSKIENLDYPGANATWVATRRDDAEWAVAQTDEATGVVFGLRRTPGAPGKLVLAVAVPVEKGQPTSVRLLVRDPAKYPNPWLSNGGDSLLSPPRTILDTSRVGKPAASRNSALFVFDVEALGVVEAFDPREAVIVEFARSGRKLGIPSEIAFEVGDLRAAHAFALIPHN